MRTRCIFHHVRGPCPADALDGSPYCRAHGLASHMMALEEDAEEMGGKVIKGIHLTEEELLACHDWIREGDSPRTIGLVTTLLKRLIGGG